MPYLWSNDKQRVSWWIKIIQIYSTSQRKKKIITMWGEGRRLKIEADYNEGDAVMVVVRKCKMYKIKKRVKEEI